jgi:hypothetical protein
MRTATFTGTFLEVKRKFDNWKTANPACQIIRRVHLWLPAKSHYYWTSPFGR